jgi:hypothetical protein
MVRNTVDDRDIEDCLYRLYDEFGPGAWQTARIWSTIDAEYLGAVRSVTGCKPGIWPLPPPYDDADVVEEDDESGVAWQWVDRPKSLPFNKWANDANQSVLESVCRHSGAFYANDWFLVDAALGDKRLRRLIPDAVRGAPVESLFDVISPSIGSLKWILVPCGDDVLEMLFATSAERVEWVDRIDQWCRNMGRDYIRAWKEARRMYGTGILRGQAFECVDVWVPL